MAAKKLSLVQEEIDVMDILLTRIPGRGARKYIGPALRVYGLVRDQLSTAIPDEPVIADVDADDPPVGAAGNSSGGRKRRSA